VRGARWWHIVSPPPSSRWYKNYLRGDPGPSSLPSLGRMVSHSFPQYSYSTLPHPCVLLGFFHLECKDQDLLKTLFANKFVVKSSRNQGVRFQYAISANAFYFNPSSSVLWSHTSLMFWNQITPMLWVVWGPHIGTFTWCSRFTLSSSANRPHPDWQDATFILRTHKPLWVPKAQGSCPSSLVLP
jgi:hypothetical protein